MNQTLLENNQSSQNPTPQTTSNVNDDGKPISFEEYKIMATQEDVTKFRAKMKPKWWENFPVFGSLVYAIRMTFLTMMIDRGPLRAELYKWHLIFSFLFLFTIYSILMFLTPWFFYFIVRTAVVATEKRIKIGNV